jgi:hypothetical protein
VAEASLTGFLELVVNLGRANAELATLHNRVCTLWIGVLLGSLALMLLLARQHPSSAIGPERLAKPSES